MALGEASRVVIVVLSIVVNAAIAIMIYADSPKLEVYNWMSWSAKTPPCFEKLVPVPYITKAPKPIKQRAKKTVATYPTLKSNKLSFNFVVFVLFFSILQMECHIDMSKGAGIHPRKAIKKSKPVSYGNTEKTENL